MMDLLASDRIERAVITQQFTHDDCRISLMWIPYSKTDSGPQQLKHESDDGGDGASYQLCSLWTNKTPQSVKQAELSSERLSYQPPTWSSAPTNTLSLADQSDMAAVALFLQNIKRPTLKQLQLQR